MRPMCASSRAQMQPLTRAIRRLSRIEQHTHPFDSLTVRFLPVVALGASACRISSSTLKSATSFTSAAARTPARPASRSAWRTKVVFPLPRKPVTTHTGTTAGWLGSPMPHPPVRRRAIGGTKGGRGGPGLLGLNRRRTEGGGGVMCHTVCAPGRKGLLLQCPSLDLGI